LIKFAIKRVVSQIGLFPGRGRRCWSKAEGHTSGLFHVLELSGMWGAYTVWSVCGVQVRSAKSCSRQQRENTASAQVSQPARSGNVPALLIHTYTQGVTKKVKPLPNCQPVILMYIKICQW